MAKDKKPSFEIKDGMVNISYPIEEKTSKSGKSKIIATTGGAWNTGVEHKGKEVKVGLNVYVSAD